MLMFFDMFVKCNFFVNFCVSRRCKLEFGSIFFDGNNFGIGGGGINVDYDNFVFCKFVDFGLFVVGCFDIEEVVEEVEVDFDFIVDVGEVVFEIEDEIDKMIGFVEGRVDVGIDINKIVGNGVF